MNKNISKFIFCAIIFLWAPGLFAGSIELLHANEWSVPKQASTLLTMPAIRKCMQMLHKKPSFSLMIRYPGGDEGTLWANELRSWLISLGLSSKRIELVPGSASSTAVELELISNNI